MHEIDSIGPEPAQAALDALVDGVGRPIRAALLAVWMADLRKKMEVLAAPTDGVADHFLAVAVALGGVNHIQAGVERAA